MWCLLTSARTRRQILLVSAGYNIFASSLRYAWLIYYAFLPASKHLLQFDSSRTSTTSRDTFAIAC